MSSEHRALAPAEAEHLAAAVVAEDVGPPQRRDVAAAVDVAAGDRAAAVRVAVLGERQREARCVAARAAARSSGCPRACSSRSCARRRMTIDLLALPGRRRRRTGRRSRGRTRSATGCAGRGADLRRGRRPPANGLSAGCAYGPARASTSMRRILPSSVPGPGPVVGIAARRRRRRCRCRGSRPGRTRSCRRCGCANGCATVSRTRCARSRPVRVARDRGTPRSRVAPSARRCSRRRSVRCRVSRMEREPEQPALAARRRRAGDVEERRREQRALLEDPDPPRLLDDEQAPAAVARMGQEDRVLETLDHRLEPQLRSRRPGGHRQADQQRQARQERAVKSAFAVAPPVRRRIAMVRGERSCIRGLPMVPVPCCSGSRRSHQRVDRTPGSAARRERAASIFECARAARSRQTDRMRPAGRRHRQGREKHLTGSSRSPTRRRRPGGAPGAGRWPRASRRRSSWSSSMPPPSLALTLTIQPLTPSG